MPESSGGSQEGRAARGTQEEALLLRKFRACSASSLTVPPLLPYTTKATCCVGNARAIPEVFFLLPVFEHKTEQQHTDAQTAKEEEGEKEKAKRGIFTSTTLYGKSRSCRSVRMCVHRRNHVEPVSSTDITQQVIRTRST